MKRIACFLMTILASGALLLTGCTDGTGGDRNGDDGPYSADSLDEAQAIADPLAEEWDADAFCFLLTGFQVDSDGLLRGPETLACEGDEWLFVYGVNTDVIFNVAVNYSGTYDTWEEDESLGTHYPLKDYSNGHIRDLMNKADGEFEENLGQEDYLYLLMIAAQETYNFAQVTAYEPSDSSMAGWISLDADTLEIIDASW
jgi:hypothetical protein